LGGKDKTSSLSFFRSLADVQNSLRFSSNRFHFSAGLRLESASLKSGITFGASATSNPPPVGWATSVVSPVPAPVVKLYFQVTKIQFYNFIPQSDTKSCLKDLLILLNRLVGKVKVENVQRAKSFGRQGGMGCGNKKTRRHTL
jgi:hypothetical protein